MAVYQLLFHTVGISNYLPYRLLAALAHIGCTAAIFAYALRRIGRLALLVALPVAFFGAGWEVLDVRGTPLAVIGHEGPWFAAPTDLAGCPDDAFRLCLSHTPDNIAWARRLGIDLVLAGHVHGGQIRLPLLGSVFVPSRYSRQYDCGTFYRPPTVMHVSRGLAGQHPLRFFCHPEVTRITLRRG